MLRSKAHLLLTLAPAADAAYISRVRAALCLPTPSALPSLSNSALEEDVFRPSATAIDENQWHWQHLEWFGDRVLNSTAAVVIFTVLEQRNKVGVAKLAQPQKLIQYLTTNVKASKYARQVGVHTRLPAKDATPAQLADRFEAYLGALSLQAGPDAVLEFLAPILRDELAPLEKWVMDSNHQSLKTHQGIKSMPLSSRKPQQPNAQASIKFKGTAQSSGLVTPPSIPSIEDDMVQAFLSTNPFEVFDYKKYKHLKSLKEKEKN